MHISRRTFLSCAASAAFLAPQAKAQIASRHKFAQWIQWTHISGSEWGLRQAYTLRSDPATQSVQVLKWSATPAQAEALWVVPDPQNFMSKRLFDTYDQRPDKPLQESYQTIEDFTWQEAHQLHEKIWTDVNDRSAEIWHHFTDPQNGTPIALPKSGIVVWLQPSADPVDTSDTNNTLILDGAMGQHLLQTIIRQMVEADMFLSAIPDSFISDILVGTNLSDEGTSYKVVLPPDMGKPYSMVYMRLLPIALSELDQDATLPETQ